MRRVVPRSAIHETGGFLSVHRIVDSLQEDLDGWALIDRAADVPWSWGDAVDEGWLPEEVVSLALDGAEVSP